MRPAGAAARENPGGRPASSVPGGVQSIARALELLELLADAGGTLSLSELASKSGLPPPTIHRLMRTLLDRGYVRQDASRHYTLGSRLIRLGETSSRLLGGWLRPLLGQLVRATGETANLAMLDGDEVVYVAQAPSAHQMRMFTEPGRRVRAHCTAVGKALLAQRPAEQVRAALVRAGMPAMTASTITDPDVLLAHLAVVREQGYAVDDGEQEVGVRCFAVALPHPPIPLAVSISGPVARLSDDLASRVVPALTHTAAEMSATIAAEADTPT